uniref:Phosphagen kinase C-terminal domain-containing protein n=1 Tax=Chromera velia CCMP2878 TaxID=1169474 RepID=A0A0G4I204_9ALVE|eukprot:Cvel_10275.t1-p1 / transcript=Cvel_10275.t1 / gene=Cvel_10275 / organism=Chromera_velia_CCMP2878 / gene_product=Taurocyamine kinase, putative / transcript_product=Taurocyamine kinase, putative / location=Cvel_scaffold616:49716-54490(+) / protein_length=1331 / sequence_SO=supercontig / SO=protein_coding / is_pseudo=false
MTKVASCLLSGPRSLSVVFKAWAGEAQHNLSVQMNRKKKRLTVGAFALENSRGKTMEGIGIDMRASTFHSLSALESTAHSPAGEGSGSDSSASSCADSAGISFAHSPLEVWTTGVTTAETCGGFWVPPVRSIRLPVLLTAKEISLTLRALPTAVTAHVPSFLQTQTLDLCGYWDESSGECVCNRFADKFSLVYVTQKHPPSPAILGGHGHASHPPSAIIPHLHRPTLVTIFAPLFYHPTTTPSVSHLHQRELPQPTENIHAETNTTTGPSSAFDRKHTHWRHRQYRPPHRYVDDHWSNRTARFEDHAALSLHPLALSMGPHVNLHWLLAFLVTNCIFICAGLVFMGACVYDSHAKPSQTTSQRRNFRSVLYDPIIRHTGKEDMALRVAGEQTQEDRERELHDRVTIASMNPHAAHPGASQHKVKSKTTEPQSVKKSSAEKDIGTRTLRPIEPPTVSKTFLRGVAFILLMLLPTAASAVETLGGSIVRPLLLFPPQYDPIPPYSCPFLAEHGGQLRVLPPSRQPMTLDPPGTLCDVWRDRRNPTEWVVSSRKQKKKPGSQCRVCTEHPTMLIFPDNWEDVKSVMPDAPQSEWRAIVHRAHKPPTQSIDSSFQIFAPLVVLLILFSLCHEKKKPSVSAFKCTSTVASPKCPQSQSPASPSGTPLSVSVRSFGMALPPPRAPVVFSEAFHASSPPPSSIAETEHFPQSESGTPAAPSSPSLAPHQPSDEGVEERVQQLSLSIDLCSNWEEAGGAFQELETILALECVREDLSIQTLVNLQRRKTQLLDEGRTTGWFVRFFSPAVFWAASQQQRYDYVCIWVSNLNGGNGCMLGGASDLEVFNASLGPLVRSVHGVGGDTIQPEPQLDGSHLPLPSLLSFRMPLSLRIRVARNVTHFPLPARMSPAQRQHLLEVVEEVLMGCEQGDFYRTAEVDEEELESLVDARILFPPPSAYFQAGGIGRDWPIGRGGFISDDRVVRVWVGEEDHLRVQVVSISLEIPSLYARLCRVLSALERGLQSRLGDWGGSYARSPEFGYVTSCPTNVGTGMRASVLAPLPLLSGYGILNFWCPRLGLQVRGQRGESSQVGDDGSVDLSPTQRFGLSEKEVLSLLVVGVQHLLFAEREMERCVLGPLRCVVNLPRRSPHESAAICVCGSMHEGQSLDEGEAQVPALEAEGHGEAPLVVAPPGFEGGGEVEGEGPLVVAPPVFVAGGGREAPRVCPSRVASGALPWAVEKEKRKKDREERDRRNSDELREKQRKVKSIREVREARKEIQAVNVRRMSDVHSSEREKRKREREERQRRESFDLQNRKEKVKERKSARDEAKNTRRCSLVHR